uniref:hypothetical protein n=1 Tax=Actinomyces urogenitalis TaxID=103621 RepID=UPI001E3934B4
PTTSPDLSSKQAASDPNYTLNCEEPLKCPEGAVCEVNGDGNVVFTVDLAFKPKPESPDETKPP